MENSINLTILKHISNDNEKNAILLLNESTISPSLLNKPIYLRGFCRPAPLLHLALEKNMLDLAKLLIEKGADVNERCPNGSTPITRTVQTENLDAIKFLIEKGADINDVHPSNSSLLSIFCIQTNNYDIINFLIENGADINLIDCEGDTPLMNAVGTKKLKIVKILLKHPELDIQCRNYLDCNALYIAIVKECFEIADLLLDRKIEIYEPPNRIGILMFALIYHEKIGLLRKIKKGGYNFNRKIPTTDLTLRAAGGLVAKSEFCKKFFEEIINGN